MVNLEKLIEYKDTSNFELEADGQERSKNSEQNNENNSKQMENPVSPVALLNCGLESKNNINNNLDDNHSDVDLFEKEKEADTMGQNDFILQESNLDNIHPNRENSNSDKKLNSLEENLTFYQSNDKDHLTNGIKKENNLYYFIDLKSQNDSQLSVLFNQLKDMYFEQQLLDCTLVCGNECIKAHKLVLAAVSPYFRSIFNSFNNNGCTNTAVIIQDVSARDMRLIIKIIYSINNYKPVKLSLNRAISLRESAYRLKVDFINERLDQCGVPQLSEDLILSIESDNNLMNTNSRKRKRSYQGEVDPYRLNSSVNYSMKELNEDKIENNRSSSESADENSSECSTSMKHHKYKHRYLLSEEHLDQNGKIVKCGNSEISSPLIEQLNEDEVMLDDRLIEQDDIESEHENSNEIQNDTLQHKANSVKSDSPNFLDDTIEEPKNSIPTNNENLIDLSQLKRLNSMSTQQSNDIEEKVIDFSLTKNSKSQEEMFELVNNAMNNVDNAEKVSNIYKAMKTEMNKMWTNNNDLNSNDNFSQLNNQINNHFLNRTFSQLCMANLNPETARALLLTNELIKNSTANNNQLNHHSINKNSPENSLNTSTSSTTSSFSNGNIQQQPNNSTAAIVAAAQQQLLNVGFLNKNSNSNSINKQNINGALINTTKSSNSYSSQKGSSSSSSGYSSISPSAAPVKRGRGRPPRHTQPTNISETNTSNNDNLLNKLSSPQNVKTNSTFCNISNSLSNLKNSTANSIVDSLNALNQQKKWRPNLENLLALKIRKNKPNSNSNASSPINELTNTNNSNQSTNSVSPKNSSNNTPLLNHYSQGSGTASINNSNPSNSNSTANMNGSSSSNSKSNTTDGKQQNMCPYCPQVYYSNQAMNDHINNVHTKTAFKYICEFCSKEFSWWISLNKHLKHAHIDLINTFGTRSVKNLNVTNLNGLTNAISNHLGTTSITNQELLNSFMNRDNESAAMLNFGAIGD